MNEEEVARIAEHRGESPADFARRFVRRVGDRLSLIERPGGDCVFWQVGKGCTVYSARPTQCRTWPFWDDNIESPEDWKQVQKGCPGAGKGRVYSIGEIQDAAARTNT